MGNRHLSKPFNWQYEDVIRAPYTVASNEIYLRIFNPTENSQQFNMLFWSFKEGAARVRDRMGLNYQVSADNLLKQFEGMKNLEENILNSEVNHLVEIEGWFKNKLVEKAHAVLLCASAVTV